LKSDTEDTRQFLKGYTAPSFVKPLKAVVLFKADLVDVEIEDAQRSQWKISRTPDWADKLKSYSQRLMASLLGREFMSWPRGITWILFSCARLLNMISKSCA
jgi:hypothetical protein